jgi:hypothetical protein
VTPGEMETVVLLLLAVLFLAALVSTIVLVFFRPWLIMRRDQDQFQNLETAAAELRESLKTATKSAGEGEPLGVERRSWWRRWFSSGL